MPSPHQEPDMSVEDRYYKCSEYLALSNAKKLGLKRKREAHGHQPKSKTKSHNPRNPSPGHLKQLQSSIAKLTSTIMALQAEESPEPHQENRGHGDRGHAACGHQCIPDHTDAALQTHSRIGPLESKAELDSHADTCVVGSNALIIQDFEKSVRVNRTMRNSTTNSSTKSWIAPKIDLCALHTQSRRTLHSRTSNLPLHSHCTKTTASFESINGTKKSTLSMLVGCTNRIRLSTIATKSTMPFHQPVRNSTFPSLTLKFIPKDYHTLTQQQTNASNICHPICMSQIERRSCLSMY